MTERVMERSALEALRPGDEVTINLGSREWMADPRKLEPGPDDRIYGPARVMVSRFRGRYIVTVLRPTYQREGSHVG